MHLVEPQLVCGLVKVSIVMLRLLFPVTIHKRRRLTRHLRFLVDSCSHRAYFHWCLSRLVLLIPRLRIVFFGFRWRHAQAPITRIWVEILIAHLGSQLINKAVTVSLREFIEYPGVAHGTQQLIVYVVSKKEVLLRFLIHIVDEAPLITLYERHVVAVDCWGASLTLIQSIHHRSVVCSDDARLWLHLLIASYLGLVDHIRVCFFRRSWLAWLAVATVLLEGQCIWLVAANTCLRLLVALANRLKPLGMEWAVLLQRLCLDRTSL